MIRHNEPPQVHPIEEPWRLHPLADTLNNVLLADMDNTSDQQKIQAEANHLIILPKDDQQGSHLQINIVNDLRPISLAGTQNLHTLADPLIETDNINDLHKKGIKGRQQSNLLIRPTEMHLHIPPLVYPLSNVPLTDRGNTGSRRRN